MLAGTGAKVKLGYTLKDANNTYLNWPSYSRRYESFAGASLTQPLMKNAGYDVTVAGIRLAAGESALAYQEYRRQMMMIVSRAEAAYWDLFFSQEQFRIRSDSIRVAETLLEDNRVRVQTGKASELEVLQAEAGVALRKARQQEAQQKVVESMNRLTSLFSGSSAYTNLQVRAVDQPVISDVSINYLASMSEAFQKNPDYLSQQAQIKQENIRVMYAQNQRYPELDLKGSYGVNGLGTSISDSTKDLETRTFDSWSVGVELRIPLSGGIKSKNELIAAKARKRQALLGLKAAETEIANAVDTSIRHVGTTRTSVTNYLVVVGFSQKLLQTELARLETGKTESRKVLEVEENLSEAKSVALENMVGFQKALIEWDLVKGTALESRKIELTQAQLEAKTAALMQGGKWGDIPYSSFKKEAGEGFDKAVKQSQAPAAKP
jgi:outer membrane protein TolC